MYDQNNVFAKMIRGEIPCNKICENDHAMSFHDINPMTTTHVLVIPKGDYENVLDFVTRATPDAQAGFWACFRETAEKLGIDHDFNILANAGENAPVVKQSVFHFHLHLLAGERTQDFAHEMDCPCHK
ncbi:HIT domain-containing protein [bacterium]|nr:HIT domain-containing protein [bacterium]